MLANGLSRRKNFSSLHKKIAVDLWLTSLKLERIVVKTWATKFMVIFNFLLQTTTYYVPNRSIMIFNPIFLLTFCNFWGPRSRERQREKKSIAGFDLWFSPKKHFFRNGSFLLSLVFQILFRSRWKRGQWSDFRPRSPNWAVNSLSFSDGQKRIKMELS